MNLSPNIFFPFKNEESEMKLYLAPSFFMYTDMNRFIRRFRQLNTIFALNRTRQGKSPDRPFCLSLAKFLTHTVNQLLSQ